MRIATILPALLFATPALAEDVVTPPVGYFEAGIVCSQEVIASEPAPDTIAGYTNVIETVPDFISTGRVVPGVIGVGFGVKSAAAGENVVLDLTVTVTHPPMGPDGVTEQSFPGRLGSEVGISFYELELPYEVVTGEWTLTASTPKAVIWSASFTVVEPRAVPELAGVCGYADLLS